MQGVALTSLWIAAVRAVETDRTDALFRDPFARKLAGDEGLEILRQIEAISPQVRPPTLQVRTRFLDDEMQSAVAGGIRQIVSLAAGMDARAFRLDFSAGTTFFEVDQPEVLAYKASKLSGAAGRCDRRAVSVDLRNDWSAALTAAGFDRTAPTLWLVEGLILYLQAEQVSALFARVNELAAPKSVLLFDCIGRSALDSPYVKYMLDFVASIGAPWVFGSDEPEGLLEPLGWDVHASEMGEVGTRMGRWPFPVAPRRTPGVPNSFLVKAIKR